jgi:transcription initiation factor IIF auxiliary subunit
MFSEANVFSITHTVHLQDEEYQVENPEGFAREAFGKY